MEGLPTKVHVQRLHGAYPGALEHSILTLVTPAKSLLPCKSHRYQGLARGHLGGHCSAYLPRCPLDRMGDCQSPGRRASTKEAGIVELCASLPGALALRIQVQFSEFQPQWLQTKAAAVPPVGGGTRNWRN